jgi:hypothetical protein
LERRFDETLLGFMVPQKPLVVKRFGGEGKVASVSE